VSDRGALAKGTKKSDREPKKKAVTAGVGAAAVKERVYVPLEEEERVFEEGEERANGVRTEGEREVAQTPSMEEVFGREDCWSGA